MPNFEKRYDHHCRVMASLLAKPDAPKPLVAMTARLILEAHYQGRWKMLWAISKGVLKSHYIQHWFTKWEWIRTKVFRRAPNPALAAVRRADEEEAALDEMANGL